MKVFMNAWFARFAQKEKSGQDNIRDDEQDQFKKAAKVILALSDEQIHQLIVTGQFEEISQDG